MALFEGDNFKTDIEKSRRVPFINVAWVLHTDLIGIRIHRSTGDKMRIWVKWQGIIAYLTNDCLQMHPYSWLPT